VLKKKVLNKVFLSQINKIAHSSKLFTQLKKFNKDYSNFDIFIDDFEIFLVDKIDIPSKDLSSQDRIFEGIILRLDYLLEYKNLVIKIYLESQKNPKYFLTINKYLTKYFKNYLKSPLEYTTAYAIYVYAFNIWIEDTNTMDKTMAAIGNSFEGLNKIKTFLNHK
tara:strand:- start:815 stop:1309 length:495 start_codon:yes stop_codon:yes gene_type:complete